MGGHIYLNNVHLIVLRRPQGGLSPRFGDAAGQRLGSSAL